MDIVDHGFLIGVGDGRDYLQQSNLLVQAIDIIKDEKAKCERALAERRAAEARERN